MRIAFGADHAGFELKERLKGHAASKGHEILDLGTGSTASVDYPDFERAVGLAVAEGRAERGVAVCGTGIGIAIAANKVTGIRAGVPNDLFAARLNLHERIRNEPSSVLPEDRDHRCRRDDDSVAGPGICRTQGIHADLATLGKSGVKLTRLGFGTGTNSGQVQRDLGMDGFSRLYRYAYERGITYIDTADGYGTHKFVKEAIQGIPREKLFILSKMWWSPENVKNPMAALDRYRSELGVEYLDCLLIHCTMKPTWPEDLKPMMDAFPADGARLSRASPAHGGRPGTGRQAVRGAEPSRA